MECWQGRFQSHRGAKVWWALPLCVMWILGTKVIIGSVIVLPVIKEHILVVVWLDTCSRWHPLLAFCWFYCLSFILSCFLSKGVACINFCIIFISFSNKFFTYIYIYIYIERPDGTYALLDLPCCWFESTPLSLPQKNLKSFKTYWVDWMC